MALVISSDDPKPRSSFRLEAGRTSFRSDKKPSLLRDYLKDDYGSCSSNGFQSFPRRQCCVAVRNLIELEVRNRSSKQLLNPRSRAPVKSKISPLQRASMAVIKVVKRLPFKSSKSSPSLIEDRKEAKKSLLSRSFSRKLFRINLWKKKKPDGKGKDCAIERWISSAGEKYQPLDLSNTTTITNATGATTTTVWTSSRSNSNSGSKTNSWSDGEFTSDYLLTSSENDAVERSDAIAATGEDSMVTPATNHVKTGDECTVTAAINQEKLHNEEEKEQLSPVCVLEFPDDHEDEHGSSSPFTSKLPHLEGRREKLMQKLQRFECFSQVEPVNLENRIAKLEHEEDEPPNPSLELSTDEQNEDEDEYKKADRLLEIVKANASSSMYKFEVDNLLLDFLKEKIKSRCDEGSKYSILRTAENWLKGCYDELLLGWEVKDNRQAYIRDMEEGGAWRGTDVEKEEVALEFVDEISTALVEEVLLEFAV